MTKIKICMTWNKMSGEKKNCGWYFQYFVVDDLGADPP